MNHPILSKGTLFLRFLKQPDEFVSLYLYIPLSPLLYMPGKKDSSCGFPPHSIHHNETLTDKVVQKRWNSTQEPRSLHSRIHTSYNHLLSKIFKFISLTGGNLIRLYYRQIMERLNPC